MANTRDIRRRIKSIKNTAQITKAMQMVAASKMRKAQMAALAGRPFAQLLNKVIVNIRDLVDPQEHPLLEQREVRRELVVVISTDKGLCGALNTNLLREVAALKGPQMQYVAIGRRGAQFITRTKRELIADFNLKENAVFTDIRPVARFCIDKFLDGEVDRVTVFYSDFVNTLTQKPTGRVLLPISSMDLDRSAAEAQVSGGGENRSGFEFEPDPYSVLDYALPRYAMFELYQMLLESRASEHSARMVAMKSATDNAKQLVKYLTLEYNKVRQAAITKELLEITTAQLAMGS